MLLPLFGKSLLLLAYEQENHIWCTIEYVKITFPEDLEESTKDIRELLGD